MAESDAKVPVDPTRSGTFAPFRYPAFRAIWIANLWSSLGATIQSVGAAWMMTDLAPSQHHLVALVQASATIPIMLLGVPAGAIADNFDRRRVMLTAQIAMLIVSALLAVLTWQGLVTPYLLLALTLTIGMGTALNSPAWQASVRHQVGPRDLPQAISLNTIAFNLARSVGPALGGLLISLWNVGLAFGLNALSYIGMIVVLWRWRPGTEPPLRRPMLPAIVEGVRYCAATPAIRKLLLRGGTLGFGVAGYQALVPAVVRDRLHGDELDFGLMLGAFGIGSIIAAFLVAPARRRWGSEAAVTASTLFFVVAQFVLAQAHSLGQALPATFFAGAGWVSALTTINVAMQMRSPEAILGRCLSIYQAVTFGGMALGAWAWGVVADWRDLPFALHGAGAWLIATLVLMRLFAPMPKPHEGRVAPPRT
ncbi:MAG TPA: MFS transporter [Novosphingobium sp.]